MAEGTATDRREDDSGEVRRVAGAGAIGNVLEWFDFAVYGYMAPFLATIFFPSDDPLASLLAVYGAFAAGYVARPVGAVVFGHLGDVVGRKFVLVLSVMMMGVCTVAIGLLPTYEQVGVAAGVMLVGLRLLQGISVGGEFTGSAVFIAEHAPPARRGFFTSWVNVGAFGGFLLGSALAAALTNLYSDATIEDFVWRVPFLSGIVIMAVAILIRRNVEEPDPEAHGRAPAGDAEPAPEIAVSPVLHALRYNFADIARVFAIVIGTAAGYYIVFVYAISYLTERMHVSTAAAMDINTVCLVFLVGLPLLSGALSDRVGRKPLLVGAFGASVVLGYPLWWMMHHTDVTLILLGQMGFAVLYGIVYGITPATLAEIVPRHVRVSALSIGYNGGFALFGGTAPAVATYLLQRTGDDFAPVYYMIAVSLVSLVAVLTIPETRGKSLAA